MPVATAAPSIYDRTPGVLYEQTVGPSPTATRRASVPAPQVRVVPPTPTRTPTSQPKPVARRATPPPPTAVPTAPPTSAPTSTPQSTATRPFRPTWTEVPTSTPVITYRIVTRGPESANPTPTHKPGAYYEPQDFQPAVTWTPTPNRRR